MKNKIIEASIESLKKEGLKFSVDTLADKLKISKKTIYKFFPDKEALALALYEKYYTDAKSAVQTLMNSNTASSRTELLYLYFDSKTMTRSDIFNKYKLNNAIYAYTTGQNDDLWTLIASSFKEKNTEALRIIVDGAFEKLCNAGLNPDEVIKRLVNILW